VGYTTYLSLLPDLDLPLTLPLLILSIHTDTTFTLSGSSVVTSRPNHILCTHPSQLDPNSRVHPIAEVIILQEGWKRHLPISNLTNRKCSLADRSANLPNNALVVGPRGLEIQSLHTNPANEAALNLEEFIQATNCLVEMIPLYLKAGPNNEIGGPTAKAIGDAWAAHYRNLLAHTDFTERFHLYREYDIYLRTKWLTLSHSFLPADFHEDVFRNMVDRDRDAQLARYTANPCPLSTPPHSMLPRSRDRDRRDHPYRWDYDRSRAPLLDANREHNLDYDHPHRSFRDSPPTYSQHPRDSGWPSRSSSLPGSDGPQQPSCRCLFCGSHMHTSKKCNATTGPFLIRQSDGSWRTPKGESPCYALNGPHGSCPKGSTCQFTHICSLCGATSHTARSCKA
jgi:hypothetical protein